MKLAGILVAVVAALALQYFALIRPWYQTWGATVEEAERALPGDELWPAPAGVETRAITIRAAPAQVWPWVAQLGQHRGGFYSYRFLENLVGCDMPDAQRLLGLPDPRPGEKFWLARPDRYGGLAYATYARVEPERALVLLGHAPWESRPHGATPAPSGTWAFVLEPAPGGGTRVLVRGRSGHAGETTAAHWAASALLFDPIHFVMERKLLLGLRDRAEGRPPAPAWVDVTYALLWIVTGALGLAALVAALFRRAQAWRPLAAATAALLVLTLLFFARPRSPSPSPWWRPSAGCSPGAGAGHRRPRPPPPDATAGRRAGGRGSGRSRPDRRAAGTAPGGPRCAARPRAAPAWRRWSGASRPGRRRARPGRPAP